VVITTGGAASAGTGVLTFTAEDGTVTAFTITAAGAENDAAQAALFTAVIDAVDGFDATDDGVDTVTVTAAVPGTLAWVDVDSDITATTVDVARVDIADLTAWVALHPDLCAGIRLTSSPAAIAAYCNINLKYYASRETQLVVSTPTGFDCNGTVTTTQALQYEQGLGYDIAQLEYVSGGWKGKPGPYRVGELVGLDFANFQSLAVRTETYDQINLGYDQYSVGGWQEYRNNLSTILAIPCADTTTSADVLETLDLLAAVAGFPGQANVIDSCVDCPD
jgi:hypothetical protein